MKYVSFLADADIFFYFSLFTENQFISLTLGYGDKVYYKNDPFNHETFTNNFAISTDSETSNHWTLFFRQMCFPYDLKFLSLSSIKN